MIPRSIIDDILTQASWAPSGDNVQPWQFALAGDDHIVIYAADTRHDTVYDLDGHPSQISFGALIETMAIAASAHGLRAEVSRRDQAASEESRPIFDVRLVPDAAVKPDPLIGAIPQRTVQRRPMRTTALTVAQKTALLAAIGPGYELSWLESFGERLATARLMYANAKLRLTMREAYEVHRRIIDWDSTTSTDKVPDQALGVDAMTLKLMKWAMVSWGRLSTMNALMGTWAPRLQMDLVPGIACAAHFVLRAKVKPATIDDYVAAGRALQRFWLTLTQLGLYMQPEMTPLIFSKYVRDKTAFTDHAHLQAPAARLAERTTALVFQHPSYPVYMGRVGAGPAPAARSLRKPLARLMQP